jgi:hypothetical protein
MNDKIKPEALEETPLHEMTLEELEAELTFREGMRHAYDGGRQKLHATLQARINTVRECIVAIKNGREANPDSE